MKDLRHIKLLTLEQLNEFINGERLRCYQLLIVSKIDFSLNYGGELYSFTSSECKKGKNVCYFSNQDKNYKLSSSHLDWGYKLQGELEIVSSNELPFIERNNGNVKVISGHSNFAHFIWNQLPALLELKRVCNVEYELLEDHNTIFPLSIIKEKQQIVCSKGGNEIHVGSRILDKKTSDFLLLTLFKPSKYLFFNNKKIIYLGLRGSHGARVLSNEVEFYSLLITKIFKCFGDKVHIIVDGFSFQNNNINNDKAILRCNEISDTINTLISRYSKENISSINGANISDFISIAKSIDFYVTHEGTMQHKIGWLTKDSVGFLLTGSKHPKTIVKWHLNQIENSCYQTIYTLEKGEAEQEDNNIIVRNNSFSLKNIKLTTDNVLDKIKLTFSV